MRKYIVAAALGLGTVATGATAAATLAGAQTNPTPTSVASTQQGQATRANAPAAKPDPVARIKQDLAPLVKDGTLTQAQADKVADTLKNAGPGPDGKGHGPAGPKEAAAVIGIDENTLHTELQNKSLAQVAEAHGRTRQQLIDGLVKAADERIDQEQAAGRLTPEQATQRKSGVTDRVTREVDEVRTPGQRPGRANGPSAGQASGGQAATTTAPATTPPANP